MAIVVSTKLSSQLTSQSVDIKDSSPVLLFDINSVIEGEKTFLCAGRALSSHLFSGGAKVGHSYNPYTLFTTDVEDRSKWKAPFFNNPLQSASVMCLLVKKACGTTELIRVSDPPSLVAMPRRIVWGEGFKVLSSNGGWLLLGHALTGDMRFFNVVGSETKQIPNLPLDLIDHPCTVKADFVGDPSKLNSVTIACVVSREGSGTFVAINSDLNDCWGALSWVLHRVDDKFRDHVDGPIISNGTLYWVKGGTQIEGITAKREYLSVDLENFCKLPTSIGSTKDGLLVIQSQPVNGIRCAAVSFNLETAKVSSTPPPFLDVYCVLGRKSFIRERSKLGGKILLGTEGTNHVKIQHSDGRVQLFVECPNCSCDSTWLPDCCYTKWLPD